MAKRRRTTRNPQQNPRNMGNNRVASMRGNARNLGQNQPFQGGIGQGVAVEPQAPGQVPRGAPSQGGQPPISCPPGLEPGRDPNTGAQTCKQVHPNISGNVPVNNADRAIAPKPGIKPKGY